MTKTKATVYDYYQQLNLNIAISDTTEIDVIVDNIYEELPLTKTNSRIAKEYLKVLILNLANNHSISPKLYTGTHLRASRYNPKSRYNKNEVARKVTDVIHALHKAEFVELHKGYNDKINPVNSYITKIKATTKLIKITKHSNHKLETDLIGNRPDTEPIVLRNKVGSKNVDVEYEDNEEILNYRQLMIDYNNLINSTHIDVYGRGNKGVLFGKQKQPIIISQKNKFVRRIFNSPDLSLGGRMYGGWWQQLNSEWRSRITFNGMPTTEIDFSGMGISLLYDHFNKPMFDGDAYDLSPVGYKNDNYTMEELRPLLKQCLMIMTNSNSYKQCLTAIKKDVRQSEGKFPSDVHIPTLIDAFAERHEPIKEFFYSSVGSQQHRLDSEIATNVIAYYLYGINRHRENLRREGKDPKQKVANPQLVLCIHDSFIIRADWYQSLESVMEQAYINHLQLNPLKEVKTKKEKIEFSKTTARKLKRPIRTRKGWTNIRYFKTNKTFSKKRTDISKDKELQNRIKEYKKIKPSSTHYSSNEKPKEYLYKNIPKELRIIRSKKYIFNKK
jgi:hypothetical protein